MFRESKLSVYTDTGDAVLSWLLNGDPSVRWQAMRDIENKSHFIYEAERIKIASEGWGRMLLEKQDIDGTWGGGLYTPKWISTTYTMLLLRQLGLRPANIQALKACRILLDNGYYEKDGGINYFPSMKHSETCVTGMILSILCYFGYKDNKIHEIASHLLDEQMDDGGWNCRRIQGARHSSFHTTVSVLEGLKYYMRSFPGQNKKVKPAVNYAHEFLLMHRLYKSDHTGNIIDARMTRLSFPPHWRYDILRILDYFQSIRFPRDERMSDAIELLKKKRNADGMWNLQQRYPGKYFFDMESVGSPSRWNTLRALRVMRWWEK